MVRIQYGATLPAQEISPRDILGCTRYETVNGEHYIDLITTRILERGDLVGLYSDIDQTWREYVIWSVEEPHEGDLIARTYRCVWSLQALLSGATSSAMPGTSGTPATATQALTALLSEQSAFQVGTVEPTTTGGASFWRMSAWEGLSALVETWGGEVQQRGGLGSTRYIDLLDALGNADAFTYNYGSSNIAKITRKMPDGPEVCRIIPLGAAEQTDSGGYGRKIDITSVNGGKAYLEDAAKAAEMADSPNPTATAYVENSEITTPAELLAWGREVLESITQQSPTYEVELVDIYQPTSLYTPQLGDTGMVTDDELGTFAARITSLTVDELAQSIKAAISTTTGDVSALVKIAGGSFGQTTVNAPDVRTSLIASPGDLLLDAAGKTLTIGTDGFVYLNRSSGDAVYSATRTDTGVGVRFGVGGGGTNHGVYSAKQNRWLIHGDASSIYIGGTKVGALAYKDNLALTKNVLTPTGKNTAAIAANANATVTLTATIPANCYVVGIGACVSSNATMVSRGFDIDGYVAGTCTIKTYWRNVGSASIVANAATITAQVVYMQVSAIG